MPNPAWRASFQRLASSSEPALLIAPLATAGDIPGDNTSTTTITVGGAVVSSDIDGPDDNDFIKVQLSAGQTYQFSLNAAASNGLDDPVLDICAPDGTTWLGYDDDSGGNLNSRMVFRADSSGTFFLNVEGIGDSFGDYTLTAVKATVKVDDHPADSSTTGTVTVDGASSTGLLEATNDYDWFAVQLTAGFDYTFTLLSDDPNGYLDTYLELYDSSGEFIDGNNDISNTDEYRNFDSLLTYTPDVSGTYFLSAEAWTGIGPYRLFAESDIPGDITTSTTLAVGGTAFRSSIAEAGDIDFIKVTLTAGQAYQFSLNAAATNGLDNPFLAIYNSDGTALLGRDDDSGGNLNARLTFRAETSGTYFLDVEGFGESVGDYTLTAVKATIKADDYPADTSTNGTVTVDGDWSAGLLEATNDYDWFKVQLVAGRDYVFTLYRDDPNGYLDTFLELYDSSGEFIDGNNDIWYSDQYTDIDSQLNYRPDTSGTYYVSAEAYQGIGAYWLLAEEDDYPADASTDGMVDPAGASLLGNIQHPGDVDWIGVELTAGQSYLFYLGSTTQGGQPDPLLQIHDPNGAFVSENDDAFPDVLYSTLVVEALVTGTHFLAARDALPYGSGGYSLSAYAYKAGSDSAETLTGGAQDDWIEAFGGHDSLVGGPGNDWLWGYADNDTLVGSNGADYLYGGTGNDLYILDIDDYAYEYSGEGVDTVQTALSFSLGDFVENLTLTGTAARGTGNSFANTLTGNDAANTLSGGDGNDTLKGAGGADSLIGGTGKDRLIGGPGNDSYLVGTGDVVVEVAGAGTDTIRSDTNWNFSASANAEVLILTGGADINATGDDKPNKITGNTGDNELNGRGGADTLTGGKGDDIYTVDAAGDRTIESSGEGTADLVRSSVSWTLAANVEDLLLTGTAAINGTGNSSANRIEGNAGANRLDGKEGVDTLLGKAGNDSYFVDQAADTVVELAGEGTDTVTAAADFVLPANVETLKFVESAGGALDRTGTGNALPNVLEGGAGDDELNGLGGNDTLRGFGGDDTLNGGAGADSMVGGSGDDVFEFNDPGDVYVEIEGEGAKDTVEATITHTLLPNVENLKLEGVASINGTGNVLGNVIEGNSGDNRLSGLTGDDKIEAGEGADTIIGGLGNDSMYGGTGVDVMQGGDGNDTYYVDDPNDDTVEVDADDLYPPGTAPSPDAAGSNIDSVISQVSYTLRANIENLQIEGNANLSGTGNGLDNILTGNGGANLLKGLGGVDIIGGGEGNDTLAGGDGNDKLAGGAGADAFVFDTPLNGSTNVDSITDFTHLVDKLRLDDDVFNKFNAGASTTLTAAQFYASSGSAAHDADDRIVYNTITGALFYDPDGTGSQDAVRFALLTAKPTLTAVDFLIIG